MDSSISKAVSLSWSFPWISRAFFLSCMVVLLAFASLNYIINPFGIYNTGFFRPWRINLYQHKQELFLKYDPLPNALIMGSSRAGCLDPDLVSQLTGKTCFHWGGPMAGRQAFQAILDLAIDSAGADIDLIVLGVDPVIFHPDFFIHPQLLNEPVLSEFLGSDLLIAKYIDSIERLFTIEQVRTSLLVIRRELGLGAAQIYVEYQPNGFPYQVDREAQIAAGTYDLDSILTWKIPMYPDQLLCLDGSVHISDEKKELWEDFLDEILSHGIKLYAFIPTEHPRMWAHMVELGAEENYRELAEYLDETVTGIGGTFRDYHTIDSFGGSEDDFYDEVHMRKQNGDLLLNDLLSDYKN